MPVIHPQRSVSACGNMADMSQGTYWRDYFMARHQISLTLGVVLLGVVIISTLSGKTLVKYRGMVSRADDPKSYWLSVAMDCILGVISIGIHLYTTK